MMSYMKEVVKISTGPISISERNLLSTAYKNAVGIRRASWRIISGLKKAMDDGENKRMTTSYSKIIEDELRKICTEILDLVDQFLLPKSTEPDSKVFYMKMKGDYYRYMAECEIGTAREGSFYFRCSFLDVIEKSRKIYAEAFEIAKTGLGVSNPIRLGLVLNFTVFYYEILKQIPMACEMAQKAFDEAMVDLQGTDEETQRDSTLILQLMRDNLNLWKSEGASNDSSQQKNDDGAEEITQDSDVELASKEKKMRDSATDPQSNVDNKN